MSYFALPSVWSTPLGTTLAARQAVYADPESNSAAYITDIANFSSILVAGADAVHGVVTNSDPLKTLTFSSGTPDPPFHDIGRNNGWNVIHIPNNFPAPATLDHHVVLINSDDSSYVWQLWGLLNDGSNNWSCYACERWDRSALGNIYGGRGMGTNAIYTSFSESTTAGAASADIALGDILKTEIDAGDIPHALRMIHKNVTTNGTNRYPCKVTGNVDFGERIMLNPDFDVDGCDAGTHMKIIMKAAQKYGFITTDYCGDSNVYVNRQDTDWTGYSFSGGTVSIMAHCRWVKATYGNAYSGEQNGDNPPVNSSSHIGIIRNTVIPYRRSR